MQYNCNLIERCLHSSGIYIEAGQALGFLRGVLWDVWRVLQGFWDVWQSVTGGQNWSNSYFMGGPYQAIRGVEF